jgi:hypothetical protein
MPDRTYFRCAQWRRFVRELIATNIDVRTVAGQFGHGGGGAHKGGPAIWSGPSRGNEPVLIPMYA